MDQSMSMLTRNLSSLTTFGRRLLFSRPLSTSIVVRHAEETAKSSDEDAPVDLSRNPYEKEKRKCLLCRTGVELDYKNSRLLQQFVSTFSGRVYDRHITGLCDGQQRKLIETIALSRKAGYMPILVKDPKYVRDPKLFDPLRPVRPHSFA